MPYYFVIVRREIAQIKFITETKCVLYFGYCERKPMNGFSEKKSLKGLFTQPSFSQPIFGEIIQTKKFYKFDQNVSSWSAVIILVVFWSLSWLMTIVVIMVTIRFNQKEPNLRNDVNSSSETVILWPSARICSCWLMTNLYKDSLYMLHRDNPHLMLNAHQNPHLLVMTIHIGNFFRLRPVFLPSSSSEAMRRSYHLGPNPSTRFSY